MKRQGIGALVVLMIATACGQVAAPTSEVLGAKSHAEFVAAACSAFDSMFEAIGNPDAGGGSELSKALDAAVTAGDVATAERLANESNRVLDEGRRHAAVAAGWGPGAAMMAALDRFLAASQAMVGAKRVAAGTTRELAAAQAAFEAAGGVDAWTSMLGAAQGLQLPPDATPTHCPNVPITL
jgi:hypothetical protein